MPTEEASVPNIETLRWYSRFMIALLGISGTCIGVIFLLGDAHRFAGPALEYARAVPGGIRLWGVVFLVVSVLVLMGIAHRWHGRVLAVSLWALATCYLFFSISIWLNFENPGVALTGGVTYLELAAVALTCGVVARRRRR